MAESPKPAKTEREWWALLKSKDKLYPINGGLEGSDRGTAVQSAERVRPQNDRALHEKS